MKNYLNLYRYPALLACLFLTACAGLGQSKNIDVRAQERWDTLLAGDLAGAYEYLSPGQRSSMSSLEYQRGLLTTKVNWTAAQVLESDCSEDACEVTIDLDFAVYGALPGVKKFESSQVVTENWVRADGQWWYIP